MSPKEQSCKCGGEEPCQVEEDLMECKTEIGQQMEALRAEMEEIKESISELLEIFKNTKGFVSIVGSIGGLFRWAAYVGIAVGAIYAFFSKVKL